MSKTCILPWLHFFTNPTGKITPCCIYGEHFTSVEGKTSIDEIINSSQFKELRLKMINGEEDSGCKKCYNEERLGMFSDRLRHNDSWKHYTNLIEQTNEDGSIDNFKMRFLDIRWENTCNLRCRTCDPYLSSRIAADYIKLKWLNKPIEIADMNIIEQYLTNNIGDVEEFYFVGGEPLLMSAHYKILESLINAEKYDARLTYSTNLATLTYKNKSVVDYWKKLTNLLVMVSLDAMEERAEYLRSGTNWVVLLNNIKTIKTIPHLQLKIASVFSVYNALHLPDLQKFLLEQNIVNSNQLEINVAYGDKFCPRTIAPAGKKLVQEKVENFLKWSKANNYYSENLQTQWDRSLVYMNSEHTSSKDFIEYNNSLDNLREELLIKVFPEIQELVPGVGFEPTHS